MYKNSTWNSFIRQTKSCYVCQMKRFQLSAAYLGPHRMIGNFGPMVPIIIGLFHLHSNRYKFKFKFIHILLQSVTNCNYKNSSNGNSNKHFGWILVLQTVKWIPSKVSSISWHLTGTLSRYQLKAIGIECSQKKVYLPVQKYFIESMVLVYTVYSSIKVKNWYFNSIFPNPIVFLSLFPQSHCRLFLQWTFYISIMHNSKNFDQK